jgi:hypothetical protein
LSALFPDTADRSISDGSTLWCGTLHSCRIPGRTIRPVLSYRSVAGSVPPHVSRALCPGLQRHGHRSRANVPQGAQTLASRGLQYTIAWKMPAPIRKDLPKALCDLRRRSHPVQVSQLVRLIKHQHLEAVGRQLVEMEAGGRTSPGCALDGGAAAFSIRAATSPACDRKIAWLPTSSMVWDWARFAMNLSRSGSIIRSCVGITA